MGDNQAIWGKFYMVIGRTCKNTNYRHKTIEEAQEEAERLCRQAKEPFAILEAIEICQTTQAPVTWSKTKEKKS